MQTGFLNEEDVRIVSLLIKNQISSLLKDRSHYVMELEKSNAKDKEGKEKSLVNSPQLRQIHQQQQQYKHTEITIEEHIHAAGIHI